jgi:hypothetical protein
MQFRHFIERLYENGHAVEKYIDPTLYKLGDGILFNSSGSCCNDGLERCSIVLCIFNCGI